MLLRFVPLKAGSRAWTKLKTMCTICLCDCLRLRVPTFDDAKLLAACMLWPPACFVSDATDAKATPSCLSCLCLPCWTKQCAVTCEESPVRGPNFAVDYVNLVAALFSIETC